MGAAEDHDIRHLVPFSDYVLYVVTEVREGGVHPPDQVLVPVDAMLVSITMSRVKTSGATNSSAASGLCWFQTSSYNRRMTALFSSAIDSSFPSQPLMICSYSDDGRKHQSCQAGGFPRRPLLGSSANRGNAPSR